MTDDDQKIEKMQIERWMMGRIYSPLILTTSGPSSSLSSSSPRLRLRLREGGMSERKTYRSWDDGVGHSLGSFPLSSPGSCRGPVPTVPFPLHSLRSETTVRRWRAEWQEWGKEGTGTKMQRLDWSLSRKVTQDIKTQPQINHYHSRSLPVPFVSPLVSVGLSLFTLHSLTS